MKKKGFTLIEIIVVIAILGIIMAISAPSLSAQKKNNEKMALEKHIMEVNKAVRQYYALEDIVPSNVQELSKKKYVQINEEIYQYGNVDPVTKTVEVRLK